MVDFGDELIIESYKIPWLIWIQLVVTLLLVFVLFFGFAIFSFGASTASLDDGDAAPSPNLNSSASSHGIVAVEDDVGANGGSSTREGEESPVVSSSIFRPPNHPCNYFGLAKNAIFKCLGLDSNSESSSSERHEHEKRD